MQERLAVCLTCLLGLFASCAAAAGEVREYRLDNGMRVLVKPDHRAPVVVSQVWYKVGSSFEHNGLTGISHVLEHMMFKGTEQHGPGEFSRVVAANGGSENAFTGRDYTAYYQQLAKDRLEIAFELEADRMRNLTLPEGEFKKELAVVQEERRLRTEDQPQSLTYEQFTAVAYRASPYRNPVIGWMGDLEALQVEDLRDWYRMWYAPNNATLVVVGDVDPEQVFALAKKYFGPLAAEPTAVPKPQAEPKQLGETRVTVKAPARQPYLVMGYKTPVLRKGSDDWEPYALEMLAAVLDGGSSARFSRNLVRGSRVAASVSADYSAYTRLPGMLTVSGIPSPERSVADLEAAILQQLEAVKTDLVAEEELARVRAQVVAGRIYEQDSVYYQAMQIGMLETIGLDWRYLDAHVEQLKRITPEQVRAVARKYLVSENRTVAELEPLPLDGAASIAQAQGEASHVH